ncbi:MAG: phosphopantetheine-binding protein [Deltaproteobacteria bacterium]
MIDSAKVRHTIAQALGVDEATVSLQSRLSDLADLDSLSLVEIASALDDDFGVRLPGDALVDALKVADLVELVERAPRR